MNINISKEELRDEIEEFLLEHKSASIATCKDNMPRCSPVQYYMGKDLDIFIPSAGGEKFDAISSNPKVCLLVNTEYIDYRKIKGVQIFGKAELSMLSKEIVEEARAYIPKYLYSEYENNKIKIIKIKPDKIVYLNSLENGDRTKQILNLEEDRVEINEDCLTLI